jgi:hypothetical protein
LWGDTTNKNVGELIEQAIAGVTTLDLTSVSGNYTLTSLDGTLDQARSAVVSCQGTAAGAVSIIIPTSTKLYVFRNACGQTITIKTAGQIGGVVLANGEANSVFCDGTNALAGLVTAGAGTTPVSGGGTGQTSFTAGFLVSPSPGGTTALTTQAKINLLTDVANTLPVANGGTGQATLNPGGLLIGNGTGSVATLTGGNNGYVPTWNSTLNTWVSTAPSAAGVTSLTAGTGISLSGATGNITITNTSTVNTSNPTFSTSVTSPIYNVGNSVCRLTQETANELQFYAGNVGSAKVTSAGLGAFNIATSQRALFGTNFGSDPGSNYTLSVIGQPVQSAVFVQNGSGGQGSAFLGVGGGTINAHAFYSGSTSNGVGIIQINSTSTAYLSSSDRRLKSNIALLTDVGAKIDALQPRTFTWNKTGEEAIGFIADEIQMVSPTSVSGTPNGVDKDGNPEYQHVDASTPEMVALMVAELQALRKRVAALEAKAL